MLAEHGHAGHHPAVPESLVAREQLQGDGIAGRPAEQFGVLSDEDVDRAAVQLFDDDVVQVGAGEAVHGRTFQMRKRIIRPNRSTRRVECNRIEWVKRIMLRTEIQGEECDRVAT